MHPKFYLIAQLLLITVAIQAQNTYHELLESEACTNWIRISNPPAEVQNQTHALLILQTGGAEIFTEDNSQFGQIDNINGLGLFEINRTSSATGDTLFLEQTLVNEYALEGLTQVIMLPLADSLDIEDYAAPAFDGSLGGVVFLTADSHLSITGTIDASGRGYAGGTDLISNSNCNPLTFANDYYYSIGNWRGAPKGSGGTQLPTGRELGRGPLLNGGGGGNDHNAGGGGGANVTRGGAGGTNETPGVFTCNGNFPGLGGYGLPNADNRLYLGGGGGSGHANNNTGNGGGNGGGLIVLISETIQFGSNSRLLANGNPAPTIGGDGGGGGGAGGTLAFSASIVEGTPADVDLSGGNGGDVDNENFDRCMGPGGGGSGGRFVQWSFGTLAASLDAGTGGIGFDSEACDDGENTGQDGEAGLFELGTAIQGPAYLDNELASAQLIGTDGPVCMGSSTTLSVDYDGCLEVVWLVCPTPCEDLGTSAGGNPLGNEASFQVLPNGDLQVSDLNQDTLVILAGLQYLDSILLLPSSVTLVDAEAPMANFTFVLVNGQLTLNPSPTPAGSQYEWDYGDGNGSTDSLPAPHIYTEFGPFTISLIVSNVCGSDTLSQSVFVSPPPAAPTILANTFDGCAPFDLMLFDASQGIYDSLYWSLEGGMPMESFESDPVVTYTEPGEYLVRLQLFRSGIQNGLAEQTIRVFETPVVDFETELSELVLTTTNLSEFANTYSWDFGDDNQSNEFEPVHTYLAGGDYEVTLMASNPGCADSTSQLVSVISSTIELSNTAFKLYPNPTRSEVWLEGPPVSDIRLFNFQGQQILLWTNQEAIIGRRRLDLGDLPVGGYLLLIESEKYGVVRQRIIVE
ncbi:MAG: PKD domain-containing protein [Bacteroidota bacterium]